jgi:hypothetical protein
MADDGENRGNTVESKALSERKIAQDNWDRYEYGRQRGHREYVRRARRLEDLYLGGGRQWIKKDRDAVEAAGRPALEINEIMPAVNAAIGYQIANRVDISFKPRGGLANQEKANVLSKVAMQVADNQRLHWKETEVFSDGLIQQRGYFDIRIGFDDSLRGEVRIGVLDPLDVIPDPDAKSYEPEGWGDVIVSRWLTLDEIEEHYGKKARNKADEAIAGAMIVGETDFGESEDGDEERNKFGNTEVQSAGLWDAIRSEKGLVRLRVIERQKWEYKLLDVVVSPDTGDVRVVEGMDPELLTRVLASGGVLTSRRGRRVRWIVSTWDALIFDDYSPYPWLTPVPYFAYFRRGKTVGFVDNAEGPQIGLNKTLSQFVHVVNTTANSGWMIEQDSLSNMSVDELKNWGAKAGLVIEYKKGFQPPKKIEPNQIPQGLDRIIDRFTLALKENTVPDAARGIDEDDLSGVSRQAKQYAAQQQLAIVLDNLSRTRHMLADRIRWCIQNFYDDTRIFRITRQDPTTGQKQDEELAINVFDPQSGNWLNDMTVGEYDVVISEQPAQVTFENSQFQQAKEMRELGVNIPDDVLVRNSNLAEKNELLQRLAQQQERTDPLTEAEVALKLAQAEKVQTEKVAKAVEAQFSAIQTAQTIAMTPATAPLADALLKSAGYIDQDAPPIVPNAPAGLDALQMPTNTNPLTPLNPENPAVGMNQGIEGGGQ